ncbi:hypothetical protein [Streptomyces durhamensis]|uniref:hypothetical protein n=1 Tax=Streptomyces durhamensis TaxID=68194 RepID=UPI0004CD35F1|nr:hypothetical protein [Streptomyces durhamensis]
MTPPATRRDNRDAADPELTGIRTLGYANRFATWDSEFRYDGRIRVPVGVKIKQIKYSYYGNGNADTAAGEVKRGRGGIGREYEVIDLTFLDDADVITFTLRGDLDVDADPRPAYSRTYQIRVDITLDDGTVRTASPQVEVLGGAWDKSNPEKVGRPFVRLPYDTGWGGTPNSQAGFGYVCDDGRIPGDKFIIDLVNLREGAADVDSNHSDSVYYQLVHEGGTPSAYTPTPQVQKATGHPGGGVEHKVTLPPIDLRRLGDKPGYYRFLVWPQSSNADGGVSDICWNPKVIEDAFQIGSVYYRYTAPRSAALSVFPGGPPDVRLTRAGDIGYPGVRLVADEDGTVPAQTVRVSLPQGKGLRFVAEDNPGYLLTVQGARGSRRFFPGAVSADGQRITFKNVDLGLLGKGSESRAWVAAKASPNAPLGATHLNFRVGDRTTSSTTINVVS